MRRLKGKSHMAQAKQKAKSHSGKAIRNNYEYMYRPTHTPIYIHAPIHTL